MKPAFGTLASGNFKQHARYNGCVVHYAMAEGGGIVLYNAAQNINQATLTGGPTWTSERHGHCLSLDGSNDYGDLGTSSFFSFPNQYFTVSFWMKTSTLPASVAYIFARRDTTQFAGGYFIRLDSGGTLTVRIIDGQNSAAANRTSTSTTLADGTWQHVLVVFKTDTVTLANNDVSIYVNARLDQGARTDSAFGPYSPSTFNLIIGCVSDLVAGQFYAGLIDEFRMYNREVTPPEIMSLYLDPYLEFIPRKRYLISAEVIAGASAVNRMRMGVGA